MGVNQLTHFSLFGGVGGIDLAAEWAGFRTVGQCEFADFPARVLERHWPDVPRWRDIRDVSKESFRERTGLRTIDVVSGGFPCQPFSVAGKQKGKEDSRYLWPEMLRVIRELTPSWVVGENVSGILRSAADDICKDLEREGYDVGIFDYEAAAVGAWHRRERVFFVANARGGGLGKSDLCGEQQGGAETVGTGEALAHANGKRQLQSQGCECQLGNRVSNGCEHVPHADHWGGALRGDREFSPASEACGTGGNNRGRTQEYVAGQRRSTESQLGGMADGIPRGLDRCLNYLRVEPNTPRLAVGVADRKDRLKALGNAVVPQQIYPIFQAIAEVEKKG